MESSFYMYETPQVEEVMYDPVDEVVVVDCCPASCYRVFPCCQGDPDSPMWQEWYKHRLQISRLVFTINRASNEGSQIFHNQGKGKGKGPESTY